jgi:hypothetical protein
MKINFLLLSLTIFLFSCGFFTKYPVEKKGLKHRITYSEGMTTIYDYSVGNVIYLSNGCIKYKSYNYGHPDTVILCGTFKVENCDE